MMERMKAGVWVVSSEVALGSHFSGGGSWRVSSGVYWMIIISIDTQGTCLLSISRLAIYLT